MTSRIPRTSRCGHQRPWALTFIGGHAIWSIAVPIAIVEALVPTRSTTPWLGRVGLTVTGVVFLLGSTLVFNDHQETQQFLASPPQLTGTAAVIVALIGAAFAIRSRPRPKLDGRAPDPWLGGAAALVASGLFFARPESWLGVAMGILLLIVMTVVITRWSRREGWAAAHRLALAAGTLLTYAWGGFVLLALEGAADTVNLIGQAALVLGMVALLLLASRTARRTPSVP